MQKSPKKASMTYVKSYVARNGNAKCRKLKWKWGNGKYKKLGNGNMGEMYKY